MKRVCCNFSKPSFFTQRRDSNGEGVLKKGNVGFYKFKVNREEIYVIKIDISSFWQE